MAMTSLPESSRARPGRNHLALICFTRPQRHSVPRGPDLPPASILAHFHLADSVQMPLRANVQRPVRRRVGSKGLLLQGVLSELLEFLARTNHGGDAAFALKVDLAVGIER